MSEFKEVLQKIVFVYVNNLIKELTENKDISISMFNYLDTIYLAQEITPSVLAEKMKVSRPASTRMLKRLVNLGYIKKTHGDDSRTYKVSLTDKAIKVYKKIKQIDMNFIEILDKHINFSEIENIEDRLKNLLYEYERK